MSFACFAKWLGVHIFAGVFARSLDVFIPAPITWPILIEESIFALLSLPAKLRKFIFFNLFFGCVFFPSKKY